MLKFSSKNQKSKMQIEMQKGFFIAELLVATFVFSIVMTVAVGSIILALDANKKTQSFKSVLNNLNVAMDTMTKSLATSSHYNCGGATSNPPPPNDCGFPNSGDTSISFLSSDDLDDNGLSDDVVVYAFNQSQDGGYIERTIHGGDGDDFGPTRMTAPEVDITNLEFFVFGSELFGQGSTEAQPRVIIVIHGEAPAGPRNTPTEFMVQTMVSQLVPDWE